MFARVLGPFMVIVGLTAILRSSHMRSLVSEFAASALWAWVAGAFVLLGGLIVVSLHQYWHGLAAIIVSVIGWLFVLRGVLLLAFPDTFVSLANNMMDATGWWMAACIVFVLIGLYLGYVGWVHEPHLHMPHMPHSTHASHEAGHMTPSA
jgi:hypothetical protein